MPRFPKTLKILAVVMTVSVLAGLAVGYRLYQVHVVQVADKLFTKSYIMSILEEESEVLYRDSTTRLGVFFSREHRDHVEYRRIPQACIDAVVAAEDDDYFHHYGVDPLGIARAMIINLKAGKVVQGGSTLTQQTAKNLFYRPDRSFQSKWREFLDALRLEHSFSKEEILEFYLNQFHVSGNGRGIGIAARYFFDKDVEDLDLLECAFMAGMVKAPAHYNPWLGNTEEERSAARRRAVERTGYVLAQMLEEKSIDGSSYDSLVGQEIPFKKGTFRYERSVLLDAVESALAAPPLVQVLEEAGHDSTGAGGLRIITTFDAGAQRAAQYGLWHHLTEVGTQLEGLEIADFLLSSQQEQWDLGSMDPLEPGEFHEAVVVAPQAEGEDVLRLDLGGGRRCVVDQQGLQRVSNILYRAARKNRWVKAGKQQMEELRAALVAGSGLWVSVRDEDNGEFHCDLEVRPRLQGAEVLLKDGQVLAMVGGNDNRNLNRATQSVRQFGSTWKPMIYLAALQLGWLPTDILDNRRGVFPFEGTWYYPRPDHEPETTVTLAWAGTRSENLASIWLLYHLVDRLDQRQIASLAKMVDLAPRAGEQRADYIVRIRDKWGVIALDSRVEEGLFELARARVLEDLESSGRTDDIFELRSLHHGRGFERERRAVISRYSGKDRRRRTDALERNFLRLEELGDRCRRQAEQLWSADFVGTDVRPTDVDLLGFRDSDGVLLCSTDLNSQQVSPVEDMLRAVDESEPIWLSIPPVAPGDVLVDGILHLSTLDALRGALEQEKTLHEGLDPWSVEMLYSHRDFRRLLGMRYVAYLARQMGITQDLPPVLSLPLGASEVSLMDMASVYQTFLNGKTYRFPGQSFQDSEVSGFRKMDSVGRLPGPTAIIREIRDRDGEVIYRAVPTGEEVADPVECRLILDILRNVVLWGTGRRARNTASVNGRPWPLMGKTGTTNQFKNAAFLGFVPRLNGASLDLGNAYTLAVYVGYDDNQPMRRGTLKLSGSSGALPAWINTVELLAKTGLLGDMSEWSGAISQPEGFVRLGVQEGTGWPTGVVARDGEPSMLTWGGRGEPRRVILKGDQDQDDMPPS